MHYLQDMILSMNRIAEYMGSKTYDEFRRNYLVVDAIVRNFEIIGEAAKNVPEEIKSSYPKVPWKKMIGLRNLISHEYFGLDYEMLWKVATESIPENKRDIENIIFDLKGE